MISRFLLPAAALIAAFPAQAVPGVTPEAMRRHIEVLASDAYEGRKPGTAGENKSILYIASQFQAAGLQPGAGDGSWYQPVGLVERSPFGHRVIWTGDGAPLAFDQQDIVLVGKQGIERLQDAPVYFVGRGLAEQLAGADLHGAVALLLYDAPDGTEDFPSFKERARAVAAAGAAAVIGIAEDVPWSAIKASFERGQVRLGSEPFAPIQGVMPLAVAASLVDGSGGDFEALMKDGASPVRLPLRGSFDVSTRVDAFTSHNVIGRLKGSGTGGESLLYLGHWDHLGICRPNDPTDKICNGAVDNASGIAMLIEIAKALANGPRPQRDILFMATTGEEMGLLGARYFAAHPVVPLQSIVAAVNIDTVAIAHKGEPVAIVGRGTTPLDPIVDATARELGRGVDSDLEANAFVQRQDGWELTHAGVPTVMVGGSFSDMAMLGAFLSGPYHKPNDDLDREIILDGAAEDADLMIALGRRLADPALYQPSRR